MLVVGRLVGTLATSACRWTLGRDLGHYVQVVGRCVGTSASSARRGTLCIDLGLYALVEGADGSRVQCWWGLSVGASVSTGRGRKLREKTVAGGTLVGSGVPSPLLSPLP